MRACGLGNFIAGIGFHSMDQVRKQDGILDKEDWDIVAYDIYGGWKSVRN